MSSGLSWNLINIKSPSSVIVRELWDTGVMFVFFAAPRTVFHPHVWSKATFELLFLIILWPNDYNMVPITGSWFFDWARHTLTQTTLYPHSYFKCVCLMSVFTGRRSWNGLCKIGAHSSQSQTTESSDRSFTLCCGVITLRQVTWNFSVLVTIWFLSFTADKKNTRIVSINIKENSWQRK